MLAALRTDLLWITYLIVAAFLVSAVCVRISIYFAFRFRILDEPLAGRFHAKATPLLGGVGMFVAMVATLLIHAELYIHRESFLPQSWLGILPSPHLEAWHKLIPIVLVSTIIVITGFLDDLWKTSSAFRLAVQVVCAAGLVAMGVHPTLAHIPDWAVYVVTILWIVGITNAFNLLDGLDGLAGSVAAIACGVFLFFMLITGQKIVAILLAALLGTILGFLFYNWHPAKTFMGSAGSLLLGFLLAVIPLISDFMDHSSSSLAPLLLPILVLSVPLYDTLSVIVIRLYNGRSPLRADHNHLAHRLRRLNMSVPQTVAAISLLGISTGLMSLLLQNAGALRALIILLSEASMFSVFIILERIHIRHRDTHNPEAVSARLVPTGEQTLEISGKVRVLTPERVEVESESVPAAFATYSDEPAQTYRLTLLKSDVGTHIDIPCRIAFLTMQEANTGRIMLHPGDGPEAKEQLAAWITQTFYPGRGE